MFGSGDLGMGISIVLIDEFSDGAQRVTQGMLGIESATARLGAKTFLLNQFSQGLETVRGTLDAIIAPGAKFDQSMQELSALTGISGAGLDDISKRALGLAKTYGGDASGGVDTFKNILSKLGPEVATNAEALQAMGADAFTLSKTMNNDLAGATAALTTSMNIYAGSITDPLLMSQEMTRQMNVMAAGARVGSAEVVDIAASIRAGGLAAKSAGVSFEELNALIQIMGKGAVYGSEAGVAIRNVLGIMSQGEYLPKKALAGLQAAGVNLALIGDAAVPIEQRLREISKIQGDAALVTEVFGRENSNAFRVLAENLGLMGGPNGWVAQMTGTSDATTQAAVVMQSFSERMARMRARFDTWKIAVFEATKAVLPYVQTTLNLVQGVTNLAPAYVMAKDALTAFRASSFLTQIANVGLMATFEALAVSVWTALAPLLPFIAIAAAVVAVVWLGYKAMSSFQELMAGGKVEGGFWGVLQQIGGVITGIIEAWSTWNGGVFTFSEQMRDSLEKIGVLDLTLRLATWAIRIKEFLLGIWDGLKDAGGWIAQAFGAVWQYLEPLLTDLGDVWLTIKKLAGDTLNWRIAGQVLGDTLGLIAKVVGGVLLAVLTLVGLALVVVVKVIHLAIDAVQYFILGIQQLVSWLGEVPGLVMDMWDNLKNASLADIATAFFGLMVSPGAAIVLGLKHGIAGAWDDLKTWFVGLVQALPLGGKIIEFFGGSAQANSANVSLNEGAPAGATPAAIGRSMAQQTALKNTPMRGPVPNAPAAALPPITNIFMVDGTEVHRSVMNKEAEANSRHGGE